MFLTDLSPGNFTEEEIGEPFMCVTLEPGDLLYFPRGTIHQVGVSCDVVPVLASLSLISGCHSPWLTLSAHHTVHLPDELVGKLSGKGMSSTQYAKKGSRIVQISAL